MKTKTIYSIIILIIFLNSCKKHESEGDNKTFEEQKISGTIILSGAYALSPAAFNWAKEFQHQYPSVKVKVYEKGTGEGIKDLIDKKASIAMVSRDATPEENNGVLWKIPVARDGVGLIVNSKNPYLNDILTRGFTQAELAKIFTSPKQILWSNFIDTKDKNPISIYTRADNSGAAEVWANFLFCTQSDLKGKACEGDPGMIDCIKEDIYSIGYCNLNYAFDNKTKIRKTEIQVIPIDLNNNGKVDKKEEIAENLMDFERNVWSGKYPKCLCRYLYLTTLEKPTDPVIIEFIKFTQGKGQEIVTESGLCQLNSIEIENNYLLLK